MAADLCFERGAANCHPAEASPNRGGRPSRMTVALRGLQPLRRLGVLDGELQALAEADLAGSATCAAVAVELISRRLGALGQPTATQEPAS